MALDDFERGKLSVHAAQYILELEEALKPFAKLADEVESEAFLAPKDDTTGLLVLRYGDLRRAAEAIK